MTRYNRDLATTLKEQEILVYSKGEEATPDELRILRELRLQYSLEMEKIAQQ